MIKLFKKLGLLFLILLCVDRISGTILERYFYQQKHGDDYVSIQLIDSTQADILIFGSSRASHHYVSDSIKSYTGLEVYNGGRDNMGIHYTYATLNEVLKRYQPQQIVFDIIPYNFIKGGQDGEKYFEVQSSVLLPFANRHQQFYERIHEMTPSQVWEAKLVKSYAYNSLIGSIFQNSFTNIGHKQVNGYEPLEGVIDSIRYVTPSFKFPSIQNGIDLNAFKVLAQCLELCKKNRVRASVCFSPFYFYTPVDKQLLHEFKLITEQYQCQLIDFSTDTSFVQKPNLFYDDVHLNNSGALLFSKMLSKRIVE